MSLNYDYTRIHNRFEKYPPYEHEGVTYENNITWGLTLSTMIINMGTITKENWEEFYSRLHAWEIAIGQVLLNPEINPFYITPEHVRDHIGLRTNVAATTKAQFKTKIYKALMDRVQRDLREFKNSKDAA